MLITIFYNSKRETKLLTYKSLDHGSCGSNFIIISKLIIQSGSFSTHNEINLKCMPQNLTNQNAASVQLMAWCCQAKAISRNNAELNGKWCLIVDRKIFAICWPNVAFMPKMWNLQPKIIFSSRIECRLVPSWNMSRSTLKRGSKVMGLGQWRKKIKIVVWCLSWQQIKAVDSLNHLKLFKNHECLKKWSYLRKRSILGPERSIGSWKIHVRDVEGPYMGTLHRIPQNLYFL